MFFFFLGVFWDVDFSNNRPIPPPNVVQAAGSIRLSKEYVYKRKRWIVFLITEIFLRKNFRKNSYAFSHDAIP